MRRSFLVLAMVAVLGLAAAPGWSQDLPEAGGVCCKDPATGEVTYWAQLRTCPKDQITLPLSDCGITPQPTPTPVVVPTPVPTVAPPNDGGEVKEIKIPTFFKWIFDLATGIYGKTLVIPAGVAAFLITLTGILTRLLPNLKGRWAYACTAALGGIAVLSVVSADGVLSPSEYWTTFLAILGILGGPFLYNFTFGAAKDKALGKK